MMYEKICENNFKGCKVMAKGHMSLRDKKKKSNVIQHTLSKYVLYINTKRF